MPDLFCYFLLNDSDGNTDENIEDLKKVVKTGNLFESDLKDSVFLMVLEIVLNVMKNKENNCRDYLSSKTVKKLKKSKKQLKYFLDNKKPIKKRKKKFVKSPKGFRKFMKKLINEFANNCLELHDEN